jgi:cholesterol transport system auxiliary component
MIMRRKFFLAAGAALALSGCFGGARAPSELMTLTAAQTRPADATRTAAQGQTITIVEPTVPQALRTNRVPVHTSPTAIAYLQDAQWVEAPNALFGRLLSEVIAATTGRVVLDPNQYTHDPGTRITGQLQRFGYDAQTLEVVAVYDAVMERTGGAGVTSRRFEARTAVAEPTPAAIAPALNEVANRIAADVAAWVGS